MFGLVDWRATNFVSKKLFGVTNFPDGELWTKKIVLNVSIFSMVIFLEDQIWVVVSSTKKNFLISQANFLTGIFWCSKTFLGSYLQNKKTFLNDKLPGLQTFLIMRFRIKKLLGQQTRWVVTSLIRFRMINFFWVIFSEWRVHLWWVVPE